MKEIIGVDPGIRGAAVSLWVTDRGIHSAVVAIKNILINPRLMNQWFPHDASDQYVFIEKIPKYIQNTKISLPAMCCLYGSYKYLLACFQGHTPKVQEVIPQRWQRTVCGRLPRMEYIERKRWLKAFAVKLAEKEKLNLRITLQNCDAFLIAYYGFLTIKEGC